MGQYADLFDDNSKQQAGMALRFGIESNPDESAKMQELAKRYNLPAGVVKEYKPEYEQRAKMDDGMAVIDQSPKLRGWLSAEPQRAEVTHDDLDNMGALEATARYITSAPNAPGGGLSTLAKALVSGGTFKIGAGMYGAAAGVAGLADQAIQTLDDAAAWITGTPKRQIVGTPGPESWLRAQAKNASDAGDQFIGLDKNAGFILRSVVSGVESAGQNLAMLPFGMANYARMSSEAAMLGLMGLITGGTSYTKGRDEGLDPARAFNFAAQDATAEIVTEKFLGMAGFLKNVKAGAPATKLAFYEITKEIPGEMAATVWQNFNEWANLNPEKSVGDFLAEQPEAIAQTVIATMVGGSTQIGAVKAIEKAVGGGMKEEQKAATAEAHAKILEEMQRTMEASKVLERSPDTLQSYAQSLMDEGADTVYVNTGTLKEAGVDIQQLAQILPSVATQITQAEHDGDMAIPTGELLTATVGTTFAQPLIDNLRTDVDGYSRVEAQQYMAENGDRVNAEIERVMQEQQGDQEFKQQRDELQAQLHDDLNKMGRWSAAVNKQYATLVANYYSVMAARTGMTPRQFADLYQLRFSDQSQQGAQYSQGQAYVNMGGREVAVKLGALDAHRGYVLAPINVSAFDAAFKRNENFYIGPKGEGGIEGRYERFADFQKDAKSIDASNVAVDDKGRIMFGDGRHRYSFMRDNGATSIPVAMDKESLANAVKFGYVQSQAQYQQKSKAQAVVQRSLDELVQAAESQSNWRDWYNRHEATLVSMFGSDSDLFQKLLSATSQATGVKGNVTLALKAYDQLHAGLPFEGYLPAVIKNLERIKNEEALAGAKISQYGEANDGNTEAIAVDRHIAMLFFNVKTPTKAQIASAKERIREVANRLGWEPRQVQAALWAFNQVRLGTDPSKVESYDKILEARADFIAALRARHGRGEGAGVQAGGATVAGNASYQQAANAARAEAESTGAVVQDVVQVDQLIDNDSIPVIDLPDFIGKKVFPTIADRTGAAALYKGIDSSQIEISIPLLGGPFFPLRQSNQKAGVVWSNRGEGVTSQKAAKLKEGANYMLVVLGDADMHKSNTTVNNAFFATLEAYIRDKRITPENAQKLTQMVVESKNADKKIGQYMAEFPGLSDVKVFDEYIHRISFEARARILEIMGSKEALSLGAPSMPKILDATREPSLAGYNWGDGVLLLEVDQESMQVDLGKDGTMKHPDYPLGIKGKVVGRLKNSINYELLWQDWMAKWEASKIEAYDFTQDKKVNGKGWDAKLKALAAAVKKGTISEQAAGMLEIELKDLQKKEAKGAKGAITAAEYDAKRSAEGARDAYISKLNPRRAFELAKPIVDVTQDLVDRIGPIKHANIEGPRQAELAAAFAADNWRTSDSAVNKGGVSQQEYLDAIANSTASAVLSEYTPEQVKADVKAKKMRIMQLGQDGKIFFALKYGNPGYAQDYNIEIPEIGDNEVTLTSVVNNEQGARGLAGPGVILTALEEGATVLDCFAVKNDRNPDGYLPMLYADYGFKAVAEVPFGPQYYSPQKLADAVKYWKESTPGYDPEVHGYPPLVIMKWEGTDEQRTGIRDRYLRSGIEGILEGGDHVNVAAAEAHISEHDSQEAGQGGSTSDAGGTGGNQGAATGHVPSRLELAIRDIANLSDNELRNLGLTPDHRASVRKALGQPESFNQGERGQVSFPDDMTSSPSMISMLDNADLSTFIHEGGHFFLQVQADLASRIARRIASGEAVTDGEKSIVEDMDKTLAWMGVNATPEMSALDHWFSMSTDEKRQYHEMWARGFEAYAFEGKAPSLELQGVFQTFRAWLLNVYKSILKHINGSKSDIGDALQVKLSDEVRSVMDRMLATTEQIQEAEAARNMGPLFKSPEDGGMDTEAYKMYHDMGVQATQEAIDDLQARSLRDMQWLQNARSRALKKLQKQHDAMRSEIRSQVRTEVMSEQIYQVWAFLTSKNENRAVPGVTEVEGADVSQAGGKLRTQSLRDMYGTENDAIWRTLSQRRMTSDEIGFHPDNVADMFGYESGDAMVKALAEAEDPDVVIENMTDMRMLQENGDLATKDGLERAADAAIHNDARVRFVATELRALQHAMSVRQKVPGKKSSVDILAKAAKDRASAIISRLKVRDLRPAQYAAAEARAARAAEKARGDVEKQAEHKRNQLINLYAAKEAYKAQEEIDKALDYFKRVAKPGSIPAAHHSQILALLSKFDLHRATTMAELDNTAKFRTWAKSQLDAGLIPPNVDLLLSREQRAQFQAELMQRNEEGDLVYQNEEDQALLLAGFIDEMQVRSYKEATVEEIRGLRDAIKQIEHIGRRTKKVLTDRKNREFSAVVASIRQQIEDVAERMGRKAGDTTTPNDKMGQERLSWRGYFFSHIKAANLINIMDGGAGGPMWEHLMQTASEAADGEVIDMADAHDKVQALLKLLKDVGDITDRPRQFPSIGRSLNRQARIVMALNMGNDSNMQRLLGGYGWTMDQVKPVLDTLTAQDWQFVQGMWDLFESYRPRVAEMESEINGVEPEWIVARPLEVQTADGKTLSLRGGYAPVIFDPRASGKAASHANEREAKAMLQAARVASSVNKSFTKERVQEVHNRPLMLSLDAMVGGIQDTIHYLHWQKWIIDANRLVKALDEPIRTYYGAEVVTQLRLWAAENAAGVAGPRTAAERKVVALARNVSFAGLAFNVMSAVKQVTGYTQSIAVVGARWMARGAGHMTNPRQAYLGAIEKSDFMKKRATTRMRDLAEVNNTVQDQGKIRTALDQGGYAMMLVMQTMVDIPTWWAGYEKAIDMGRDEIDAVAYADQVVIDAQGSGLQKDLAAIERASGAIRLLTGFMSFMNTTMNVNYRVLKSDQSVGAKAVDLLLVNTVPVLLAALIGKALTPGGGDDDEEDVMKKLAADQLGFVLGQMVGIREIQQIGYAAMGAPQGDYGGSVGTRMFSDALKLAKQVGQGDMDDSLRKAVVNFAGDVFRLPAAQINRTVTGVEAVIDGEATGIEAVAAPVFGFQKQ